MKFANFSSEEAIQKWVFESYEECKASYPIPVKSGIAFDVGANIGGFCIHAHSHFDRIYAFEPLAQNYNIAASVLEQMEIKNVVLYNTAIYSESGKTMTIYANSETPLSGDVTIVPDGVQKEKYNSGQSCETISLKDAMNTLGLEKINYLKLDCEGSEYEILESFDEYDRIDWICMEIHGVYDDERRMNLLKKLRKHYYLIDCGLNGRYTIRELLEIEGTKPTSHYINHTNLLCINRNLFSL